LPLVLAWDSKFISGNFEKGTSRSIRIHAELLSKILHLFSLITSVLPCTPWFAAFNSYATTGHSDGIWPGQAGW
jgi:hypothetical protein